MVVIEFLYEIAGSELDVIEFRKVENMRLQQHGRGDIQLVTNIREIVEKAGIREAFLFLIDELFSDFSCGNEFCLNLHASIIQEIPEKVKKKRALEKMPFHPLPSFFERASRGY